MLTVINIITDMEVIESLNFIICRLKDNDGTWKYNCINMEQRVKEKDGDYWNGLISTRK